MSQMSGSVTRPLESLTDEGLPLGVWRELERIGCYDALDGGGVDGGARDAPLPPQQECSERDASSGSVYYYTLHRHEPLPPTGTGRGRGGGGSVGRGASSSNSTGSMRPPRPTLASPRGGPRFGYGSDGVGGEDAMVLLHWIPLANAFDLLAVFDVLQRNAATQALLKSVAPRGASGSGGSTAGSTIAGFPDDILDEEEQVVVSIAPYGADSIHSTLNDLDRDHEPADEHADEPAHGTKGGADANADASANTSANTSAWHRGNAGDIGDVGVRVSVCVPPDEDDRGRHEGLCVSRHTGSVATGSVADDSEAYGGAAGGPQAAVCHLDLRLRRDGSGLKVVAGCEAASGFFGSVGGGSVEATVLEHTPGMLATEWALLPVVRLLRGMRRSSAAAVSAPVARPQKRGRGDDEEAGEGKRSRKK